jgi:hypothetical protein
LKLSGEVRAGKLIITPQSSLAIVLRQCEGKRVVIDIEPERPVRTVRANSRYWSLLVPLAGDLLSKTRDVPLSKNQVHFVLKAAFLDVIETPLGMVPVDSHNLNTKEFSEYCERIQVWLADNGYSVPEPGELLEVGA